MRRIPVTGPNAAKAPPVFFAFAGVCGSFRGGFKGGGRFFSGAWGFFFGALQGAEKAERARLLRVLLRVLLLLLLLMLLLLLLRVLLVPKERRRLPPWLPPPPPSFASSLSSVS